MTQKYSQKYQDRHLLSLSPAAQVAHLFSRCVKHMESSIKSAQKGEIEKRYVQSMKVVKILSGLSSVLSHQTEDEQKLAEILVAYYASLIEGINQFNIENNLQIAENVRNSLQEMVSCWHQVDALNQAQTDKNKEENSPSSLSI